MLIASRGQGLAPMDRDYLADLFEPFGAVTIRRMFSGFGISADGVNFALVIQGAIYLRADDATIPQFEAEGCRPFAYSTRLRTVTVGSYWRLPDRLLDDADEFVAWARAAFAAAERAALAKAQKPRAVKRATSKVAKKVAAKPAKQKRKPADRRPVTR
ncbi:TfoX/Sxy family protein [Rhodopseudomonas sp. NSM]|uniref:TfoX/Sxy family protein n=1 Tax=Rhodopseudomonas sp. NSM TaxID=3457630 RepID=UPI00403730B6